MDDKELTQGKVDQAERKNKDKAKRKEPKRPAWQERLLRLLGIKPGGLTAYNAVAGTSKHGRGKGWRDLAALKAKRKKMRKMADASRKRNRQK